MKYIGLNLSRIEVLWNWILGDLDENLDHTRQSVLLVYIWYINHCDM